MISEKCAHFAWYTHEVGDLFLQVEKKQLEYALSQIYGFHLVEIAQPNFAHLVNTSPISHRVFITEGDAQVWPCSLLRSSQIHLPLLNDSIDAIVLPHALESTIDPHQLLRETYRALIPEGHVVITGFNPMSTWGMWYYGARKLKGLPATERLYTISKIAEWLMLLNFQIITKEYFYYRPPILNSKIRKNLKFVESLGPRYWPLFGGGYLIVAVKRLARMKPIIPKWAQPKIWTRPIRVAKPSTRDF